MGKNDHESRIAMLEIEVKRLQSDQESEKRTRVAANLHMDSRLREVEKTIWRGVGALGVGMALFQVILKFVK